MTQTFRTGDRVTIGRFRTNHNYASDDYVGKTATITVVNEEYVRLDIDEGLDSWESKYLTLEQRKNPLLKVGDRVLVTEPTAIQKTNIQHVGQIRWMTISVKFVRFRKSFMMEYM